MISRLVRGGEEAEPEAAGEGNATCARACGPGSCALVQGRPTCQCGPLFGGAHCQHFRCAAHCHHRAACALADDGVALKVRPRGGRCDSDAEFVRAPRRSNT